ncbi:extracellular metalloprotease [Scenedesmus sp. PABB004]|nr:extracellular metalloprotease [Scenedesmus sp. PABB004]
MGAATARGALLLSLLVALAAGAHAQQQQKQQQQQQQHTQALKFAPPPSAVNLRQAVANPKLDGTLRRLYLQHLIASTPPKQLRAVLEPLATPDARKKVQLDIDYLIEHPDEIVPYFTSRDADEVLLLLGSMLGERGEAVDLRHLTPAQQQQLKSAVDSGELSEWVAKKYRNGRNPDTEMKASAKPVQMPPAPRLSQEQMAAYLPPFPKAAADGGSTSLPASSPPQTLDQMLASIAQFNPKSGVKGPKPFGRIKGFKPMRVPIVFHREPRGAAPARRARARPLGRASAAPRGGRAPSPAAAAAAARAVLGYADKDGTYLPPYNWWADKAALHMVAEVNKFYAGTGFQFYVKEVRWDPSKYPYLNRGDLLAWQNCGKDCWDDLSSRYNVQGGPINIWVAGSFEGAFKCTPLAVLCQLGANGLTTLVYINYDRFSPDALNRPGAWEGGAVVAAHEIGHYFGLLHTFENGCTPPGDATTDTPQNLDPDSGWQPTWLVELTQWCKDFRTGRSPPAGKLLKFRSCPNAGGPRVVDNIFNMMSYLDDVCRMAFTPNQVARLQWAAMTYRPSMQTKYAAATPAAAPAARPQAPAARPQAAAAQRRP